MKMYLFIFVIFAQVFAHGEEPPKVQSLEDLMELVQTERIQQGEEFKKREARFKKLKSQQKKWLDQARAELKKEEAVRERLQKEYDAHEKELTDLENELQIISSSLGELFGVVRQVAGDLKGNILESIVSAQIKNREIFLNQIVDQKKLPSITALRRLWLELQLEATELGQVRKFNDFIILENGKKEQREIIRVGGFNLVSNGKYLSYLSDTKQIMEFSKQPLRRFLSYIDDLQSGKRKYSVFALDPSRGALLSNLLHVPTLRERIRQGGIVGYIIILIFFIGLGVAGYRWFILNKEGQKIKLQLENDQTDENNPIGKLKLAFEKYKHQDMETLEIKLEEVIVRSLPKFEKGISTIRILAAVAPLLGLLGTVVGMIITFQSIMLFGTGDPKIMAGGISQALITTVFGLCCAIPLLLLHNLVSSRSKALIQILEEQAAGMIAKKMEKGG